MAEAGSEWALSPKLLDDEMESETGYKVKRRVEEREVEAKAKRWLMEEERAVILYKEARAQGHKQLWKSERRASRTRTSRRWMRVWSTI